MNASASPKRVAPPLPQPDGGDFRVAVRDAGHLRIDGVAARMAAPVTMLISRLRNARSRAAEMLASPEIEEAPQRS